jgi:hypothetical protein
VAGRNIYGQNLACCQLIGFPIKYDYLIAIYWGSRMNAEISFDEHIIISEAQKKAGLQDFGDDSFRTPLRRLLKALDEEANLNTAGRYGQHQRIVDLLVNRLRMQDHIKRFPEILKEEIKSPIVIVGLPRTGTTMLHRTMANDPRLYSALWYECRIPAPFPGTDYIHPDPRIAEGKAQVKAMVEFSPELAAIHPMDALAPDEEMMLLEHSFLSSMPEASANIPTYAAWLKEQDQRAAYVYLKQLLQFLQWQKKQAGQKHERWVLKTPYHLGFIDLLFEVFPDAYVVQTHRDPLQTIPSIASMIYAVWILCCDHADRVAAGGAWEEKMARVLKKCMKMREQYSDRFIDVWYMDAVKDPITQIRRIYDFIGFPLTKEAEAAMRHWALENPREKRPPHHYTLEEFGLSEEQIKRDFAEYREKYILPHQK